MLKTKTRNKPKGKPLQGVQLPLFPAPVRVPSTARQGAKSARKFERRRSRRLRCDGDCSVAVTDRGRDNYARTLHN
jgi:hypothetical protein